MILLIDNYDSFTYNLFQYLAELGAEVRVIRNDDIPAEAVRNLNPAGIVLSPGPGNPREAGITLDVIRQYHQTIPILGVCLGHQAIGEAFGGVVTYAPTLMHGKTSQIHHDGTGLFKGLPSPFRATRYHSLMVSKELLPDCLRVNAETADGVIMGLEHRDYRVAGVQFHPESILTEHGKPLLNNFLEKLQ